MKDDIEVRFSSSERVFVKEALLETSFDNDVFEQWRVQMLEGMGESKTLFVSIFGLSALFSCVYPLSFSKELSVTKKGEVKDFLYYLRSLSHGYGVRIQVMESSRSPKRSKDD